MMTEPDMSPSAAATITRGWPDASAESHVEFSHADGIPTGGPVAPPFAENNAQLVFPRLRKDFGAFNGRLQDQTAMSGATSSAQLGTAGGRWGSGAPTIRAAGAPDAGLASGDCANMHLHARVPGRGMHQPVTRRGWQIKMAPRDDRMEKIHG